MTYTRASSKFNIVNGEWIMLPTNSDNPITSYRSIKIDAIRMINAHEFNAIELAADKDVSLEIKYNNSEKEHYKKDLKLLEDLIWGVKGLPKTS